MNYNLGSSYQRDLVYLEHVAERNTYENAPGCVQSGWPAVVYCDVLMLILLLTLC
jgi:hypothetical protein